MKYRIAIISAAVFSIIGSALLAGSLGQITSANASTVSPKPTPKPKASRSIVFLDGEFDGRELKRSDAEWKRELTPNEFYIMRQEGTEPAYTGELTDNHKHGTYYCAACGLALFKSDAKFESGTGWPSFFQVAFKKNVIEKEDRSLGELRTEVECARCHAHLGHVFDDGPQPTGLRYCMNSASLKFSETK